MQRNSSEEGRVFPHIRPESPFIEFFRARKDTEVSRKGTCILLKLPLPKAKDRPTVVAMIVRVEDNENLFAKCRAQSMRANTVFIWIAQEVLEMHAYVALGMPFAELQEFG